MESLSCMKSSLVGLHVISKLSHRHDSLFLEENRELKAKINKLVGQFEEQKQIITG